MTLRRPPQASTVPAFDAGDLALPDTPAEEIPAAQAAISTTVAELVQDELPDELEDFSLKRDAEGKVELDELTQEQLLRLRSEIDSRLEGISFETLDLSKELLVQFRQALALQNQTANDKTVPTNQRAQVLNSLVALLTKITATQLDVHNSERQKTLETVLVRVLKKMPEELQNTFFEAFEKEVRER